MVNGSCLTSGSGLISGSGLTSGEGLDIASRFAGSGALVLVLAVRARVARLAAVFQLAMRASTAPRAAAFPLAMRARVAVRAVAFPLAVRARVAVRAVHHPAVPRSRCSPRQLYFSLPCEHRFLPPITRVGRLSSSSARAASATAHAPPRAPFVRRSRGFLATVRRRRSFVVSSNVLSRSGIAAGEAHAPSENRRAARCRPRNRVSTNRSLGDPTTSLTNRHDVLATAMSVSWSPSASRLFVV